MTLLLSRQFSTRDADVVLAELRTHLAVGKPRFLLRKSAESGLISIIQLLGEAKAWLPLGAAATVYLSTLAKHAADASWDGLIHLFKSKEVQALSDVATTLTAAAKSVDGCVEIVVGLDVPDDFHGTSLSIKSQAPEEVARLVGIFVVHVEEISGVIRTEIDAGQKPIGRVEVAIGCDAKLLLRWRVQPDLSIRERRIG